MIKALIVDDEQHGREALESMIEDYCPEVLVVDSVDTVEAAVNSFNKYKPNLLFLDIELQTGTGFDVLEKLGSQDYSVIFTTAFNHYALKAIKFSALDYLLKPINVAELKEAIIRKFRNMRAIEKEQLAIIKQQINNNTPNSDQMLALPGINDVLFVKIANIVRCESSSNYTEFYIIDNTKLIVSKTLKDYEQILVDHNFYRLHQSHIINLNHISRYNRTEGCVIMNDQSVIPIARRNKEEFLKILSNLTI